MRRVSDATVRARLERVADRGARVDAHGTRLVRRSFATLVFVSGLAFCSCASADTYKCMVDGRTAYGDRPCQAGKQATLAVDASTPPTADRLAADVRLFDDRRTLAVLQRERLERERVPQATTRADAGRARQARDCAKLTLRAKRAREDYEHAGPREQLQKQVRLRRADEDRAASCSRR